MLALASRTNDPAATALSELSRGIENLFIPVFCVGEFFRVLTEPKRPDNSTFSEAWAQLNEWLETGAEILLPGAGYLDALRLCTQEQDIRGGGIFDLQIAALCIEGGVETIWTFDRRFPRIAGLNVVNPLTLL